MFEKEAEEYRTHFENELYLFDNTDIFPSDIEEAYRKGAEFGYNKANEWHYVKDGDLPNTELGRADVTVAYINAYGNPCRIECCFEGTDFIYWDNRIPVGWRKVDIFGKIYAWKYPEKLPELPKESK